MRAIPLVLLLLSCAGRALPECRSGTDCGPTEWCVSTWAPSLQPLAEEPAGNICATACSTDADCTIGTCVHVGDGATAALADLEYAACRE